MAMLEGEDYNSFFNHHIICDIMKTMCDIIIRNFESMMTLWHELDIWYDTNRLSWNHAYAYDIIYVLIVLSHSIYDIPVKVISDILCHIWYNALW